MRGSSKVYLDGNLVGKSWLHARILFQPLFNLICFFSGAVTFTFIRFSVYLDVFAAYSKNAENDDGFGGMDM